MSEQQDGPAAVMFAADRASLGLGMELVQAGQGTATVRMTVTPAMINGHALAHGGYLFLLADTAFAFACNTYDDRTVAVGNDQVLRIDPLATDLDRHAVAAPFDPALVHGLDDPA